MSKNISISLGNHYEDFIKGRVESGQYESISEVLRAALRLLEKEENQMVWLKEALEIGEESGMKDDFDPKAHLRKIKDKHLG